jgi:hypothetical protein
MIPTLLAVVLFASPPGASNQSDSTPTQTSAATGFREMPFDEAAEGLLIRSMPLRVALPKRYELGKNEPMWGNWLWTTRSSHEYLQKHGHAAPTEGAFQIRISTNVGYDRARAEFICGPDCGEAAMLAQVKAAGGTDVHTAKATVNGIPILLLETMMPSVAEYPPSRIHIAYLATLIDTNVVLFSYTPPADNPKNSDQIWKAFEKALLGRK